MTDENPPKIGDIMGRLRDTIEPVQQKAAEAVERFAPPRIREAAQKEASRAPNRLQTIGQFVTALTWREAMAMGAAIQTKLKKGELEERLPTAEQLTAAIQDWAWNWETFTEEERPGANHQT